MKCIVIDDEPLAIKLLSEYINEAETLELVDSFSDPIKAIHFLENEQVDLIFLDIQMPELSGMQFLKMFGQKYNVILTTAYEKYAIEGYEHNVIDYLLKPITPERFQKAISKMNDHSSQPKRSKDSIFVKAEYKTVRIKIDDIQFVESLSDYLMIHTNQSKIMTLDRMKNFEKLLPENQFIRVHKSYIISVESIDFIERNIIRIGKKDIPIGVTYREKFWKLIENKGSKK